MNTTVTRSLSFLRVADHCPGDVIRYGRKRLCFRSQKAYRGGSYLHPWKSWSDQVAIYMNQSAHKSGAYDQHHPFQSEDRITFTTTDPKDAFRLRRLLASAFSRNTLTALDEKLAAVTDVFCQTLLENNDSDQLADSWSDPIDVGQLSKISFSNGSELC